MNYLKAAERSIKYLEESEADYARLKAGHQAEKERMKIIKAQQEIESAATSEAGRKRDAEASEAYKRAVEDWQEFMDSFYLVEAKRKRAELNIEMYRSVNSAMKRGNP